MSSRFVNPFTDLGFKIIFGQPASKDLLIILLNELLSGEHHIEDLTFLDKEDRSENIHDKGIIYDLYCRTSTGEYIIVEMQNRWHSHFLDRTLYYVCRAVSRQMENPSSKEVCVPDTPLEGDCGLLREEEASYGLRYRLPAVYGVFLMNFKEDGLERKFRTDTVVSDRDSGRVDRYNGRIVENDIREQAVAEGRLEGRLEIARKLKENGFSIADIVRIAGLSPEEIDKL